MTLQFQRTLSVNDSTVLSRNPRRRYLLVINNTANNVTIAFGQAAVSLDGIVLRGAGSFWESPDGFFEDRRPDDDLYLALHAISDAGTPIISIFEA
jgi:hypothetical protein